MSALFDAVANGNKWNDPAVRSHYREVLDTYRQEHLDGCVKEIREADNPHGLASDMLNQLQERWKKISFPSRSGKKEDDKLKIVMYLLPMLVDAGDPACTAFVSAFQDEWNSRFPKWILRAASGETIAGGFRRTILGIPIPDKKKNQEG